MTRIHVFILEAEEEEIRDAVLVTDGDNEIGQVMLCMLCSKRFALSRAFDLSNLIIVS